MAASAPPRARSRGNLRTVREGMTSTDESRMNPIGLAEARRRAAIRNAWDAYNGNFPNSIAIKPGRNQKNFNLKVNLIKAPVRKHNAFLFGQSVGMEVKPVNRLLARQLAELVPGQPADPAQVYLDEFWEANHKMVTLQKCGRYGSMTGDAYLKLVMDPGALYPRLVVVDPQTVEVETLPDDVDTAVKFTISYQATLDGVLYDCQQVIERGESGQFWTIQDFKRPAGRESVPWVAMNEPQVWAYAFAPLFHCPDTILPGSYHGAPAVTSDVIHLNEAYNFVLSNLYKAAHFFGHPRQVGKGFKKTDMPADPDDVVVLPSKESSLDLLEGKVDFSGALSLAARLEAALYKLLSVNGMSLGDLTDVPKGEIAALALQLLLQTLIDLTNERRLCYEQLISDVCSAVLQIAGYGVNRRVKVHWPNMLPIDYAAAAAAAQAAEAAGMSQQTALETILNVDWELEQQRRCEQKGGEV